MILSEKCIIIDETLPDDEEPPAHRTLIRNNTVGLKRPVKLPVVGKQLSNLSLNLREPPAKNIPTQLEKRRPAVPQQRVPAAPVGRKLVPLKATNPTQPANRSSRITPQSSEESRSHRSESPQEPSLSISSSAKSTARTVVTSRVS